MDPTHDQASTRSDPAEETQHVPTEPARERKVSADSIDTNELTDLYKKSAASSRIGEEEEAPALD